MKRLAIALFVAIVSIGLLLAWPKKKVDEVFYSVPTLIQEGRLVNTSEMKPYGGRPQARSALVYLDRAFPDVIAKLRNECTAQNGWTEIEDKDLGEVSFVRSGKESMDSTHINVFPGKRPLGADGLSWPSVKAVDQKGTTVRLLQGQRPLSTGERVWAFFRNVAP